jgi:hypothetical protein
MDAGMTDTPQTRAKDEGKDKSFFIITPRLVWALSRTPYDLAFWMTIKDIAGDEGTCIVGSLDLATLAMMSMGKVNDCRDYLIRVGLLKGKLYRDPGYSNEVWHLTIPNIWPASFKWSIEHLEIRSRIDFKLAQREAIRALKEENQLSPDEYQNQLSPGESAGSPGESAGSPGETKKIQKKILKEEREGSDFWKKIQSQLQSEMSKATFETWVSPTFPIGWQGDSFRVGCHNQFTADWLTARIEVTASRMLQGFAERSAARVEFVVAEKVAA